MPRRSGQPLDKAARQTTGDGPLEDRGENQRHNNDPSNPLSAATTGPSTDALVGCARVSTTDQVLDRQLDALTAAGCSRIFEDQGISGTRASRPGLDECLAYLRPDDTLVVHSLDRLGRRTADLLRLVEDLAERGVSLRILTLGVDTATPAGQLVITVMAALAQMERDVLAERTRDGLAAARARGRVGGRPASLTLDQVALVHDLNGKGTSAREIGRLLGVSARTVGRALERLPGSAA